MRTGHRDFPYPEVMQSHPVAATAGAEGLLLEWPAPARRQDGRSAR
jgi:hypothetical protein